MSLQLLAHPFSAYCQKVLIPLWADGTEFEYRILDEEHPENFAELERHWPFKQFPVLVDGGRPVIETSVIIEHLQAHHPGPNRWIPDGETGRQVRFLDRFFDQYVMNNMTCPVFNALRPEESCSTISAAKMAKDIRTRRFRFSLETAMARCVIFTVAIHGWPTTSKSAALTS